MPTRANTQRIDTPDVQPPDGYVVITRPTVRDIQAMAGIVSADTEKQLEAGKDFVRKFVREWNWVDDSGDSLPCPKDDPDVVDRLTDQELMLLIGLFNPNSEDAKKKGKP